MPFLAERCRRMAKDGLKRGSEEKRYARAVGAMIAAALLAANAGASAQSYPERPVRVLIAFPAGGTIDTLGRVIAQKLTSSSRTVRAPAATLAPPPRRSPLPTATRSISARRRSRST
jgi:hypothetical protein